jgi:hypothetical protein
MILQKVPAAPERGSEKEQFSGDLNCKVNRHSGIESSGDFLSGAFGNTVRSSVVASRLSSECVRALSSVSAAITAKSEIKRDR